MDSLQIKPEDPYSDDASMLMDELSECLRMITGDNGKNSFNIEDVCSDRSVFVIARDRDGTAVGCGAVRPMNDHIAEVKRMYAKMKALGVGTKILCYLEEEAFKMGYSKIQLETRLVNKKAVSFYEHNGYTRISNYGKYINHNESVCFEKSFKSLS